MIKTCGLLGGYTMTIQEVENIYKIDKEFCENMFQKKKRRFRINTYSSGAILGAIGIYLRIWATRIPPTVLEYSGTVLENNTVQKVLGLIALLWACGVFVYCWDVTRKAKADYLPAIKSLYQNYMRCVDMAPEDKEYYKELLSEIRHIEMTRSIKNAADAIKKASANVGGAILFSAIRK